jgi:hypothetical protein
MGTYTVHMETDHTHQYKNGRCECGAESNNGRKRRLAREQRAQQPVERKPDDLYTALRNKDGLKPFL